MAKATNKWGWRAKRGGNEATPQPEKTLRPSRTDSNMELRGYSSGERPSYVHTDSLALPTDLPARDALPFALVSSTASEQQQQQQQQQRRDHDAGGAMHAIAPDADDVVVWSGLVWSAAMLTLTSTHTSTPRGTEYLART
ncbi:hypothetical protein P280DRAFT_476466 [Massarina eburnea CBS 473.64]|uniref:Uncharacterized protein n=1 Tax=Massarina eburnea CBS 473.64 TaxID=1395130 RepID=A0A6A6SAY8_9PLEO|nr:hypothetical protein P280DRAFT_476466 [Massarina eburnea CBS 473.64]